MLLGNNLFEAFKEDVSKPVIVVTMYADTFRRQFLDTPGKLLRHAGKLISKVPKKTFERLQDECVQNMRNEDFPHLKTAF